jgi:hypothetical protein
MEHYQWNVLDIFYQGTDVLPKLAIRSIQTAYNVSSLIIVVANIDNNVIFPRDLIALDDICELLYVWLLERTFGYEWNWGYYALRA